MGDNRRVTHWKGQKLEADRSLGHERKGERVYPGYFLPKSVQEPENSER